MFKKLKKIVNFKSSNKDAERKRYLALDKKRNLDAKKEFQGMTKKQKEGFLSNDLSERVIRVEQRVSTKFNQLIPYNQTEYYKSMSEAQKRSFEKYLENKGQKKILLLGALLISLFVLVFLNFSFTGDAVKEDLAGSGIDINLIFVFMLLLFAIVLIIVFFMVARRKKKLNKHIMVIDKIVYAK